MPVTVESQFFETPTCRGTGIGYKNQGQISPRVLLKGANKRTSNNWEVNKIKDFHCIVKHLTPVDNSFTHKTEGCTPVKINHVVIHPTWSLLLYKILIFQLMTWENFMLLLLLFE